MINSIYVKNYKAFESAKVELKPITIFLGANNIGKTSLMQLFLVLQNTKNIDQLKYKSALRLHGSYVSLGQNDNIFRNKNTQDSVQIGFSFDYKEINQKYYEEVINPIDLLIERVFWDFDRYLFFYRKAKNNRISLSQEESPALFKDSKEKYISKIVNLKSSWKKVGEDIGNLKEGAIRVTSFREAEDLLQIENMEFERAHVFANSLRLLKDTEIQIIFDIGYIHGKTEEDSNLSLKKVNILSNNKSFLKLDLKNKEITSELIEETFLSVDYKNVISERIVLQSSIFDFVNVQTITPWPNFSKNRTLSLDLVFKFINTLIIEFKKNFNEGSINHVSPLRASPKRYYYVDRAQVHNVLDTSDADSITDVIKENRQNVVGKANKWLENFNINIEAKTFKELIHTLRVTNKRDNLSLDLTDVGFGISQVLPIILQGFLSDKNAITLIEQPEIHLHPKMQGDLADLFIEIINDQELNFNEFRTSYPVRKNKKSLIVETHSEYLLYRLRRRISQKLISPDDVGLYFFDNSDGLGTEIRRIPILKEGAFEWPDGFSTALEDTSEFIQNSRKIRRENI